MPPPTAAWGETNNDATLRFILPARRTANGVQRDIPADGSSGCRATASQYPIESRPDYRRPGCWLPDWRGRRAESTIRHGLGTLYQRHGTADGRISHDPGNLR